MSTIERTAAPDKWVGQAMRRKEDPRMITGQGRYVDDIVLPGMLYMAIVRSSEAHARIVSIDASAAREAPGVHGVFTGEDVNLDGPMPMAWVPPGVEVKAAETWPLARGTVKYVGQAVAVVVGSNKYGVVDAAEQVVVEYDPLPVVVDPEKALEVVVAAGARGDRHQQDARVDDRRRRHGRRLERGRRDRRAPDRQPPHGRRADRAARLPGGVPRRPLHDPPDEPEPAPDPPLHGRRDRRVRGEDPRHRPGCRRRLRREDHALRRGDPLRLDRAQARSPGQVDRDAVGAHELDDPRARPDRLREDGGQARRHDHRPRGARDLPTSAPTTRC